MPKGFVGTIVSVSAIVNAKSEELELNLVEMGFLEGSTVQVLHEGMVGGDPIAVRVDGTTIALRRQDAMAVIVSTF